MKAAGYAEPAQRAVKGAPISYRPTPSNEMTRKERWKNLDATITLWAILVIESERANSPRRSDLLTDAQLAVLVKDLEADNVERKESLADKDRICQAICAFANDLPDRRTPGYAFVGVNNQGAPIGLAISDELLLTLAHLRDTGNILPFPVMVVQKRNIEGKDVAVVEIQPSDSPPVRYKGQVWIRVGPRRGIATVEEERRLTEKRIAGARTFDQRACPEASRDDLLLEMFREQYLPRAIDRKTIADNQRSIEEQLAALRFFDPNRGAPSFAGLLVFGRDPLEYLPGAYIQFVHFEGIGLADAVKDQKTISGNLITQLFQLDNLLPLQIQTARVPGIGLQHEERPDYPIAAIREAALNAVMHRTYDGSNAPVRINWFTDRVEIQNPGGLYGQVTRDNFERHTDYRNPVIAEAMKILGHVEKFGVGIARIRSALATNGNPPPEFTIEETYFLVTLRRRT